MKKWLSLLLALGMLLGLTACGRKDGAPEADPPAAVQPEEPAAPADPPAGEPDEKGEEPVLPPQVPEEENAEDGEPQEDAEPEVWRAMVSHEDVTLFSAGETFRLTVWDVNGNAPDVCTYTSDDPAVAAVDETGGQVTAVGPGVTNVTVLAELLVHRPVRLEGGGAGAAGRRRGDGGAPGAGGLLCHAPGQL